VDLRGSLSQAKGADWEEPKALPSRTDCLSFMSLRIYVSGTTAERSLSRPISTAPILSGADWGLGDLAKSPVCCVTDSWLCGLPYKERVPDCPEREVMLVPFTRHDASQRGERRQVLPKSDGAVFHIVGIREIFQNTVDGSWYYEVDYGLVYDLTGDR